MENIISGPGISDVEKKRARFIEKKAIKHEVSDLEKDNICNQLQDEIVLSFDVKDFLVFFVLQFLPLVIIGSGLFVPGIILLEADKFSIILVVFGGFFYFYTLIRTLSSISYKIIFPHVGEPLRMSRTMSIKCPVRGRTSLPI